MVAAKLATLQRGDNQHAQICAPSQGRAGELLNVSRRTAQYAREVHEHGAPDLVSAVERGESGSRRRRHRHSPCRRTAGYCSRGKREILQAAKAIRAAASHERYSARVARIAEVSAGMSRLHPSSAIPSSTQIRGGIIGPDSETTGSQRAAAEHYPTMTLDEIRAYPLQMSPQTTWSRSGGRRRRTCRILRRAGRLGV